MITLRFHKTLQAASGEMTLEMDHQLEKGKLLTLYGESGAGKTTILRIIAGLTTPDEGSVMVNDTAWFDKDQKINQPPQQRQVGFLFQDYALFPHLTVEENLRFALRKEQDPQIIDELTDIMELGELGKRKPQTLSGGQQQRVALARSLVPRPELLLLDEPLSSLDPAMRHKLQEYLLTVHRQYGLTTILVSHDVSEIVKLSDLVWELKAGKIIREGNPKEVFGGHGMSGKFQFIGEVIAVARQEVVYVVTVLIGKNLVKVVAEESEVKDLQPGDKVLVASKAFNPVIRKLEG